MINVRAAVETRRKREDQVLKKLLAITAVGLFAASMATSAIACEGMGKVAQDASGPITTALDTQPITPKPTTKSGG